MGTYRAKEIGNMAFTSEAKDVTDATPTHSHYRRNMGVDLGIPQVLGHLLSHYASRYGDGGFMWWVDIRVVGERFYHTGSED